MDVADRTVLGPNHPGDLRDGAMPVVTAVTDSAESRHFPPHRHYRAQLVYAIEGVMTVTTATGNWVVPPQLAVWVPARVEHEVRSVGPVSMRSLYVHPDATRGLPEHCRVVRVEPLLRELILKVVALAARGETGDAYRRLAAVTLDELRELDAAPFHLPLPLDPRLKAVTDALLADPSDNRELAQWGRLAGASGRTLARLFRRETGLTFAGWRRQLRLLAAVSRLAAGEPVTAVAYELGYHSPSAFIAMFRRVLGAPPGHYLHSGTLPPTNERG